jgi:hypothetical protein
VAGPSRSQISAPGFPFRAGGFRVRISSSQQLTLPAAIPQLIDRSLPAADHGDPGCSDLLVVSQGPDRCLGRRDEINFQVIWRSIQDPKAKE